MNSAVVGRASVKDLIVKRPQGAASPDVDALAPLTAIAAGQWRALAERAVEPNGYYLPDWELAVNASARGRTGVSALGAWSDAASALDGTASLTGLVPVISLWRAYRIPLPAFVSADPYGTLCTPLLDRGAADDAVTRLMQQARKAGAHALILRDVSLDGAAMKSFTDVLRHQDRAFYFKLGVDERFAKLSPGVQLTLDLTRHFCADPAIAMADSTASADHPMINPIWRGRLAIGDVLIPLRRGDPVVSLIPAALGFRGAIREPVRRIVHFARARPEKS